MLDHGIDEQIQNVRTQAARLIAQLGAAAEAAAPFLQAITALEQRLLDEHDAASTGAEASTVIPSAATIVTNSADHLQDALHQAEARVALFQQVLMDVPTGVCLLQGQEQRYIFTNPSYDQLAGRTNVVGKTVPEVFPELANQGIHELLNQVFTTGEPFITPEILIQLNRRGTGMLDDVYFELSFRPMHTADGTIIGVVVYATDISDRRALEQERARVVELIMAAQLATEAERQRLLRILHEAPAAICTLEGPEHVFTFTNPRFNHLVGRGDLLGQAVRTAVPEVTGQGFFELLDQVYTSGVPFIGNDVPIQLDRQDAGDLEQSFLNFIYAPLRDASEQITGIFVHAVDVTELVAARQRAEAAVVVRDQFLSIAAHELKTPLTSVLGYIQLLQRRMRRTGNVDDRTDHVMTLIAAQSQRLNRLIDTLLDVARINMGQLSLELAPLDLGALTTQVVDEVRVIAEHRTIHVTIPSEACMVQADGLRLEQVLVNLLQNALKYSPNGGDVDVTVQRTPSEARVSIRDTGIGIPAAALPRLFDRFYRVSDAATGIGGMGIGLSVVDEIVSLHGGTITVDSTEGVGSMFTVSLPLTETRQSARGV